MNTQIYFYRIDEIQKKADRLFDRVKDEAIAKIAAGYTLNYVQYKALKERAEKEMDRNCNRILKAHESMLSKVRECFIANKKP